MTEVGPDCLCLFFNLYLKSIILDYVCNIGFGESPFKYRF